MNAWTNSNTGHNRLISTGPTPDGKVKDLVIELTYYADGSNLYKAIALDGHIIPLILRVPEMRATLGDCYEWLSFLESRLEKSDEDTKANIIRRLLDRIERLTMPTSEESEHGA